MLAASRRWAGAGGPSEGATLGQLCRSAQGTKTIQQVPRAEYCQMGGSPALEPTPQVVFVR